MRYDSELHVFIFRSEKRIGQSDGVNSVETKSDLRIRSPWSRQTFGQNLTTRPMDSQNRKMTSAFNQVNILLSGAWYSSSTRYTQKYYCCCSKL